MTTAGYYEDRFKILSGVGDKVFVVSYAYPYDGDVIWLISARYAEPSERRIAYMGRAEKGIKI